MKNRAHQKTSAAYGLRENPKKSLRLSPSNCAPSRPLPDKNISCKVCGKSFLTRRQLCGHLRHHSIGERQGILCGQCGRRFGSIRALCGHMKSHSEGGIRALDEVTDCSVFLIGGGVRKRARTPRFEVYETTHFDSKLNEEEDGFDVSELEEVAISLIMLSEGLEFSAAAADVSVNDVDDDCNLELVESLKSADEFNKLELEAVEMGSNFSDNVKEGKLSSEMKFEAVEMGFSYSENVMQGKLSSEMELDTSNGVRELMTIEIDIRVKDESFAGEHKNGGVHNRSSDLICDRAKPEDGIYSVPHNTLKYRCISCNRGFNSHQALGGHRSSKHKLRRCSFGLKTRTCRSSIQADQIPVREASGRKPERAADEVQKDEFCAVGMEKIELLKRCKHKCALCFKVFWSVHALRRHMRAHKAWSLEDTSGVEVDMSSHSPLSSRKMLVA